MKRIVVDKRLDIFDYVVDYAIKQHNHPEESRKSCPELSNIASRHYYIKFCGANGRVYKKFKEKLLEQGNWFGIFKRHRLIQLCWEKGDDIVQISVMQVEPRKRKKGDIYV